MPSMTDTLCITNASALDSQYHEMICIFITVGNGKAFW